MYLKNKPYTCISLAFNTTLYAKGSFEAILRNKDIYGTCTAFNTTLCINSSCERALQNKCVLWKQRLQTCRFLDEHRHELCLPPSSEAPLYATDTEELRYLSALHPIPLASCFPQHFPEGWHVPFTSSPSHATGKPDHLGKMLFRPLEDPPFHTPHRKEGDLSYISSDTSRKREKGTFMRAPIHPIPSMYG